MKTLSPLFFLLLGLSLSAQDFRFYTTRDGLPSNHIYQVTKDTTGFLWLATPNGISRFDGKDFKNFNTQTGLHVNDIFSIHLSPDNKLWFGSNSPFQGYMKNEQVHLIPLENKASKTALMDNLHANRFDFRTGNGEYFKLKDNHWKLITDSLSSKKFKGAKGSPFRRSTYLVPHLGIIYNLWNDTTLAHYSHFSENKLIKLIDLSAPVIEPLLALKTYRYHDSVHISIHQDRIFAINTLSGKVITTWLPPHLQIKEKPIHIAYHGSNIHLQSKHNCLVLDSNFSITSSYPLKENLGQEFVYQDPGKNIWLTGKSIGLGFLPESKAQNQYFLNNQKIGDLHFHHKGLLIGTYSDSIYFLNFQDFSIKSIIATNKTFYSFKQLGKAETASLDASNIFTSLDFSKSVSKIEHLQPIKHRAFKDIELHQNRIYVATYSGIVRLDSSRKIIDKSYLIGSSYSLLSFKEALYIGSSKGLKYLQNDSIQEAKLLFQNHPIPIKKLIKHSSKYFIASTDGYGIFLSDGLHYLPVTITHDLIVKDIFIENDSTLWLATQKGVKQLHLNQTSPKESYFLEELYECDGLLSDNTTAIYTDKRYLFVGFDNGLAVLDRKLLSSTKVHYVYIDEVLQDNKQIDKQKIRVEYGQEVIKVNFGVICYSGREHLKYHYKLEPETNQWISTTSEEIILGSLSPGKYTLKIRVRDHHYNSIVKSIPITILPLWWQTGWFKGQATALILLTLYLLYNWQKKRVIQREQNKAEFDKKMSGLELMALRSQMNPHFIFNSLSSIQHYITYNQKELSEKYLVKFSKLIRLFFEYSRRRSLTLKEEIDMLTNYLDIEKMRFGAKLNYSIHISPDLNPEDVSLPSMILQPILENAVNHGIFHSKKNGYIQLEFIYKNHSGFDVYIKDDGIGAEKANQINAASKKNYRSSSTEVLMENIELLNQQGDWQINYTIEDRLKKENISGTVVYLSFRLKNLPNEH